MTRYPIALLAFNRPEYFKQTLATLKMQQNADIEQRHVSLFLDAPFNKDVERSHGRDEDVARCEALFREHFPNGVVHAATDNLGIALNYDRAERDAFEKRELEACLFFEDDMVLTPHYIAALDELVQIALADERIACVACYGDHHMPLVEQRRFPNFYISMPAHWGWATTRRQWQRARPRMEQYLACISKSDYCYRDNDAVHELYASWGVGKMAVYQDDARTIIATLLRTVSLNSAACLALNIGAKGVNFNPQMYHKLGYDRSQVYPDRVTGFAPLTDTLYRVFMARLDRYPRARKHDKVETT